MKTKFVSCLQSHFLHSAVESINLNRTFIHCWFDRFQNSRYQWISFSCLFKRHPLNSKMHSHLHQSLSLSSSDVLTNRHTSAHTFPSPQETKIWQRSRSKQIIQQWTAYFLRVKNNEFAKWFNFQTFSTIKNLICYEIWYDTHICLCIEEDRQDRLDTT